MGYKLTANLTPTRTQKVIVFKWYYYLPEPLEGSLSESFLASWSEIIFWIIALVSASDIRLSFVWDWAYAAKNSGFSFSNSFHTAGINYWFRSSLLDISFVVLTLLLLLFNIWTCFLMLSLLYLPVKLTRKFSKTHIQNQEGRKPLAMQCLQNFLLVNYLSFLNSLTIQLDMSSLLKTHFLRDNILWGFM